MIIKCVEIYIKNNDFVDLTDEEVFEGIKYHAKEVAMTNIGILEMTLDDVFCAYCEENGYDPEDVNLELQVEYDDDIDRFFKYCSYVPGSAKFHGFYYDGDLYDSPENVTYQYYVDLNVDIDKLIIPIKDSL